MGFESKAQKDWKSSGISLEYARRLGFKPNGSSYAIPFFDIRGKRTGFARFKNLNGTGPKYSQRRDSGVHLYLPPFPKSRKRWARIAKDSHITLYIAEGEKKSACGVFNGMPTIGITGADCWQVDGKPLAEWSWFKWEGRAVEIIPDSDQHEKTHVRRAFLRFADYLDSLGAEVHVRILPTLAGMQKTGLDDFLVSKGRDAFDDLPCHALDSEYIRTWRDGLDTGLPEIDLSTVRGEWLTTKPAPLAYLVNILLPKGITAVLNGAGGVGKSFLLLHLSMSVACGARFLGLGTEKGRAIYIGMEDPPEVLRQRVFWLHKHHGAEFDSSVLQENLTVASLVGRQLRIVEARSGSIVQTRTLGEFIDLLKPLTPALVILDPLARLHGTPENDNSVGSALITSCERIAREVGATVLVSHHVGKDADGRKRSPYYGRGNSSAPDASRAVLNLFVEDDAARHIVIPDDRKGQEVLVLAHVKSSFGPPFKDTWFWRGDHGVLVPFTPEYRKGAGDYDSWFAALRAWTGDESKRFTAKTVRNAAREIGSGKYSDSVTRSFFEQAVEREHVRQVGNRNGGPLYVIVKQEDAP